MTNGSLAPVDTRHLFRPVARALVELLRGLPGDTWGRPTVAREWTVRDVVAHIVDLSLRRLSFHRDRMAPPPPPRPIASERDFVEFINEVNRDWVRAARRLSPRVLADLAEKATIELADWFESLPADAPGLFGVSWAGEMSSEGWFDIGREFTELWHHQEQIRMAVGAPPLEDARYLRAVIAIAVRALPHAYRAVDAANGSTLVLEVSGPAGGSWTLSRAAAAWQLANGAASNPTTRVRIADGDAWKLFFNALPEPAARQAAHVDGDDGLARPLLAARSIVI